MCLGCSRALVALLGCRSPAAQGIFGAQSASRPDTTDPHVTAPSCKTHIFKPHSPQAMVFAPSRRTTVFFCSQGSVPVFQAPKGPSCRALQDVSFQIGCVPLICLCDGCTRQMTPAEPLVQDQRRTTNIPEISDILERPKMNSDRVQRERERQAPRPVVSPTAARMRSTEICLPGWSLQLS